MVQPAFSVLLAAHNRVEKTTTCLDSLINAASFAEVALRITLYDDGSTDGTAEEVERKYPHVQVIHGNGNAYWARSMAEAELTQLEGPCEGQPLRILWLNDDVILDRDGLSRLLVSSERFPSAIIVAAVRDPLSGRTTYGGLTKTGPSPLKFSIVEPSATMQPVDTMNGNVVVVPIRIAKKVGGIDGQYPHGLADFDYGVRARRLNISVLLAPSTYGTCSRNPSRLATTVWADWKSYTGTKGGGNPRALKLFLEKIAPQTWWLHMARSYAFWWVRRVILKQAR
ncbi:glycosyltransferase family 2 protein [Arthrobacter sp. AOP36-C1-22]|uniref:glycosyltransferase family 2 protein n=1 Tax=Arthrobacter sp. AOP36-C1-22 TaxID=3457683 RepID=UPI0040343E8D